MTEKMVNRFSKFKLKGKGEEGVELEATDISQWKQECERSLLCKVWGSKPANFTGLKNTLRQLWCQKEGLKVIELGSNFYQFVFSNTEENDKVLMWRP